MHQLQAFAGAVFPCPAGQLAQRMNGAWRASPFGVGEARTGSVCSNTLSVHIQYVSRLERCKMHSLQALASAVFRCPAGQLAQRMNGAWYASPFGVDEARTGSVCSNTLSVHIQYVSRLERCKMHSLQALASAVFRCPAGQLAYREWCMVCVSVWWW